MKTSFYGTAYKTADVIGANGALCTGCEIADGKIVPALAVVQKTDLPFTDIKAAGASASAGTVLLWADGKVLRSSDGLNFEELAALTAENPFIFEQRENGAAYLYAAGDTECIYFGNGTGGSKQFNGSIYGGQFKSGRLFAADKTDRLKLRWSGEGGAFDWQEAIDGAGWLCFDGAGGRILDIVVYGDNLVAVRENCLSVLSAYGNPENFKINAKNTKVRSVCKNTAAVVGNRLIFYADGSLYSFNGAVVSEIAAPLTKAVENPVCATGAGTDYLISGYIKPLQKNATLVYDTLKNTAYIADFAAEAFVLYGGLFAYGNGSACRICKADTAGTVATAEKAEKADTAGTGQKAAFTFKSGNIDFGSSARKYLHKIVLGCGSCAEVEISNGTVTRTFKDVKDALRTDMCGANFVFTVKSDSEITCIKAVAEVADGV